MMTTATATKTQGLISAAIALKKEDCLVGIPLQCAERLLSEEASDPYLSALLLKSALWASNPIGGSGEQLNARICARDEAIARSIAWYRWQGGENIQAFAEAMGRNSAPSTKGDGLAKHSGQVYRRDRTTEDSD